MSEKKEDVKKAPETEEQQYSLNDDRRVKVLSPGALVAQRFFRNRVAVTGLVILAFMFLFSFCGRRHQPLQGGSDLLSHRGAESAVRRRH